MSCFVFYCDGSARPNPGYTGWGVHGYRYTEESSKIKKSYHPTGFIPTTHGYRPDSPEFKDQAVAVDHFYELFGSHSIANTNNVAEMQAIIQTLSFVTQMDAFDQIQKLVLITDSSYTRRGLEEWCKNWVKNGWVKVDGNPVANSDLWKELYHLKTKVEETIPYFKVEWVKGHAGEPGNEMADQLADMGVNISLLYGASIADQPQIHRCSFEANKYWNYSIDRHPLLHFKRLYFNNSEINKPSGDYLFKEPEEVYYLADTGKDDNLFGTGNQDHAFAVIHIPKEVDPIINLVKKVHREAAQDATGVVMMRLDKLYKPSIHRLIDAHKRHSLVPKVKSRINVNFLDDTPITEEVFPPGQIFRAISIFTTLEQLLVAYTNLSSDEEQREKFENEKHVIWPTPQSGSVYFQEITELFYESLTKKNQTFLNLRKDIPQGKTVISLNLSFKPTTASDRELKASLPILLGADLPPRNSLKRIETENPKISIVFWPIGDLIYQCAYIVETRNANNESDIKGIWTNYFSNTFIAT